MRRSRMMAGFGSMALCAGPAAAAAAETMTFRCEFVDFCGMDRVCERHDLRAEYFVDSEAAQAFVLGSRGQASLVVIPTEGGVTFVEVTRTGNVMTTTITQGGVAVHSRNSIIAGELHPTQYYGTCEIGSS